MSKKLIAVAAASALALSALLAAPASAAAPSIAAGGVTGSGAGTTASPYLVPVPSANSVDDSVNALVLTVSNLETEDVVRVTTTGSVKVVDNATDIANSAFINVTTLHKSDVTKTRTSAANYVFYVQTTSTTAGTVNVAVTRTGLTSSNTYTVKGVTGAAHKATVTGGVPATLANTKTSVVTFTVADIFGNVLEGDTAASTLNSAAEKANMGTVTWDATAKVFKSTMTSPSTGAFIAELDMTPANEVDGFADTDLAIVAVVNSAGSTALTSQVAALTAQLAESRPKATSVTKKKYNTLARKWNAAFPSQKVALKK